MRARIAFATLVALLVAAAPSFGAVAYTWSGPVDGDWLTATNWSPGGFSNTVGDTAEVTSGTVKAVGNTTFSSTLILRSGTVLSLEAYKSQVVTALKLDGGSIYMGSATSLAGNIEVTAASIIQSGSADNNTISAAFSGSGNLSIYNNQAVTRSVTFSGNSSGYSGTWFIYDGNGLHRPTNLYGNLGTGELYVNTGASVTVGTSTTLDWTLDLVGGTISSGGSAGAYHHTGTVTLLSDATIRNVTDYSGKHVYMDGEITGNAKLSLSHGASNRKVILNHANSYTGGTEVLNNTAQVTAAAGLGSGDLHVDGGATLEITITGVMSQLADVYLDNNAGVYGKLNLSTSTITTVNFAYVGGTGGWEAPVGYTSLAAGDYTSANLSSYITGSGTLHVLAVQAEVPEPATLGLLLMGGLGMLGGAIRRRRH
ncbi:MAG: hypothetical protein BIFFINMI_02268 [Phycisphaerae bacterium]|nr:hypothetical protein [Phycisphaerae bacterium]